MPSNSEDTAQLSGTTYTSNIASPSPPPHPSSVSAPNYGTFDPQLHNQDHQHLLSCLESSLEACFEICLDEDDNDSSSSSSSYFLSAQQSEGSSTSYPPSLSSEDSFAETGSFRFEDQSSDSEATLEGRRPGKDFGYRKACFEICLDEDDNDSSSSSSSYFLSAQQSEGSSTSYPPSLSSEDSFAETGSFRFEDQSSDSEATLEGRRPGKDFGYRSHEPMQYPGNGGS
ncbi:hypothetical protein M441DRAFT_449960 [Trichoderma asperellum CBS 433.97]|uniref:Uncharacterized protein n=1 Tax=Trichoderma asperellum (strain ATCC 204424 / CBS 433.97 / NBRC 101777) TaxID=1042311 RepID=A0A2T3YTN0_TRIA4|nr:hypothetical protein M441DRAFT_449960 [Trichoderma asperellum CBS 433.97]PTB35931.1 hypothetical protein M441DRAFT_449960 [Trichoderma asperellum CBS 433.97]